MKRLPIDEALPELLGALRHGRNAVLVAEPGAGKTTRVPLALLDEPWLKGRSVIMLEPRRLAARSAAGYMASELGETAGGTVGYRVRQDSRVSAATRIEVVTEGVLTRMLQEDPALEKAGAVIFDEFHERHLQGDLGLALCLQSQALLRDDMRLLVMSATLDAAAASELMGGASLVRCAGRVYPVETIYAAAASPEPLEARLGRTVLEALRGHEGDVLAFLPGAPEIRRAARWLTEAGLPGGVRIAELHGGLSLDRQAETVAPCVPGERKVVLATSIAESSLTVEGVRIVVDSGLMRVPRFSPRTGMSRLETVRVSRASADQRRGRAGRTSPGVCFRLWTEAEDAGLEAFGKPEIAEADLAPLALELALWGASDPAELEWLTPPPQAAYEGALELLKRLGAMDEDGRPTDAGQFIARLGIHPRLGAMIRTAAEYGEASLRTACELAALLSERDLLPQERSPDLALRQAALQRAERHDAAAQRIKTQAGQWLRLASAMERRADAGEDGASEVRNDRPRATISAGALLAAAFPDRVAQRRPDGRYVLANGRGALLQGDELLARSPYLTVCEIDDAGADGKIRLAASLDAEELMRHLASYIKEEETVEWDDDARAVRARKRLLLGAITLKEQPMAQPDEERTARALLGAIRRNGLGMLPMGKSAASLLARMRTMFHSGAEGWPDLSEEGLLAGLESWLLPHLYGIRKETELQKLSMAAVLGSMLSWEQSRELDEHAPTHWTAPSGSKIPIDYSDPAAPILSVRLQELFGLKETPKVGRGKLPLTLHLLSPAHRPVQVTRDLVSFWEKTYFEVKKDLKGRYPKHYWPDDPYAAQPTNRAKPRPRG